MNKLEALNKNLSIGLLCPIKYADEYIIIGGSKDKGGDYRQSGWWSTTETAKHYIGEYSGYTQEYLQKLFDDGAELLTPYKETIDPQVKKGDMVIIADNAEEVCRQAYTVWNDKKREMIGKKCEVYGVCDWGCLIYNENKSDYWSFPLGAFYFGETEEEEDILIKDGKKYRVQILEEIK